MSKKKVTDAALRRAGDYVRRAIQEWEPATTPSCPNELAMRSIMGLIQLSNAFMEAGMNPIEMIVPCKNEDGTDGTMTLQSPFAPQQCKKQRRLFGDLDLLQFDEDPAPTFPQTLDREKP